MQPSMSNFIFQGIFDAIDELIIVKIIHVYVCTGLAESRAWQQMTNSSTGVRILNGVEHIIVLQHVIDVVVTRCNFPFSPTYCYGTELVIKAAPQQLHSTGLCPAPVNETPICSWPMLMQNL